MKYPTITETAEQLHVSRNQVFAALREFDLIGKNNLARSIYIDRGYFAVDYRGWNISGSNHQHHYAITTVTPKGMALIQDILDGKAVHAVQGLRSGDGAHRGTH